MTGKELEGDGRDLAHYLGMYPDGLRKAMINITIQNMPRRLQLDIC
jgi:hypothetical protein